MFKTQFKYLIIFLGVFFLGINGVMAAKNPYKQWTSWGEINCTWYAWKKANDYKGIVLPGWGDAKEWDDDAKKAGYEVGFEPKENSIIVWEDWSDYGHVGYVTKVDYANDKIYVMSSTYCESEPSKEDQDAFDKCVMDIYLSDPNANQETHGYAIMQCKHLLKNEVIPCEYNISSEKEDGTKFIYLDNIPKTPVVTKSNNANLSSLTISNVEFAFNKKTLKYELQVKGDIEKVRVSAKPENSKAKVTGTGEYNLKLGNNTINIGVAAEDGTKKTYTIDIKRLDNNALLNNITISNIKDFNFNKDVFEYKVDVEYETSQITINATSESTLAKVEGLGNYDLKLGENKIDIKVTAEDETSKIYSILINRKEQKPVEEEKLDKSNNKSDNESNNKTNLNIYIIGGILFATILVFIILIIKKHKKHK